MARYVKNKNNLSIRLRPLAVLKIVMEYTDDESFITTPEILEKLESVYHV